MKTRRIAQEKPVKTKTSMKSNLAPNLFSNQAQFNAFNGSLNLTNTTPSLVKEMPPAFSNPVGQPEMIYPNPPINQVGFQMNVFDLICQILTVQHIVEKQFKQFAAFSRQQPHHKTAHKVKRPQMTPKMISNDQAQDRTGPKPSKIGNDFKWSCIEERYNTGLEFGSVVRKELFHQIKSSKSKGSELLIST